MNRLRGTPEENATLLGSRSDGEHVRSVYAPEPPLWICSRAGHGNVRGVSCRRSMDGRINTQSATRRDAHEPIGGLFTCAFLGTLSPVSPLTSDTTGSHLHISLFP